jgi:hypothetical protein
MMCRHTNRVELRAQMAVALTSENDVEPADSQAQCPTPSASAFLGVKRFPAPCGDDYCVNPRLAPGKVEGNEYMAIENETVAEISAKLKVPSPPRTDCWHRCNTHMRMQLAPDGSAPMLVAWPMRTDWFARQRGIGLICLGCRSE